MTTMRLLRTGLIAGIMTVIAALPVRADTEPMDVLDTPATADSAASGTELAQRFDRLNQNPNSTMDMPRRPVRDRGLIPLEVIITRLHSIYPGRLAGAQGPMVQGGRPVYVISWDTQGRILVILVDAQSGDVIGQR